MPFSKSQVVQSRTNVCMSFFTQILCEASKLCDISFEAAPIANDFANLYNDQAQPWELKNFALKR